MLPCLNNILSEQPRLLYPEYMNSSPICGGVRRLAQYSLFYVIWIIVCLFVLFLLIIVLSVLYGF